MIMNNFYLILIIIILIIIYYLYTCNQQDTCNIQNKINKRYVYTSPKINKEQSDKSMSSKLKKKLKKISKKFYNKKYIIKFFYTDWCSHCTNFKPYWFKIKNKYSNSLDFIEVDCTDNNPNLSFITGYPTIALYDINGDYIESYKNNRTIKLFESYIKNKII